MEGELSRPGRVRKTTALKRLLGSGSLQFLLEAHNGLSARIAEEAGFPAIWASGLAISAQFGVRDSNEASWTQVLEMLEFMCDATSVPILLDGDTGYGNFNNARRLVRKLEQRNVAGVCLEDKLFPKTNSFLGSEPQELADLEEFAGKIRAVKDAQQDPDFVVVARVEAFIARRGLAEALRRAEAYHAAGADAILIHSAKKVPDEILSFKAEWGDRCPVVIVPTKYYTTPTEVFRAEGFAAVIWANHQLRAAISAMGAIARQIRKDENLLTVEDRVAPLAEVFRLQGAEELEAAEARYLPRSEAGARALVLAASRGQELGELTADRPKAMVRIGDKPLLGHIVDAYRDAGIRDVTVVRGYRAETVDVPHARYVDNPEFEDSGELVSLAKGLAAVGDDRVLVVSYGDVLFRRYIPEALVETPERFAIAVDTRWRESANRARQADLVRATLPGTSRRSYFTPARVVAITEQVPEGPVDGEWMGFLKIDPTGMPVLRAVLAELLADPSHRTSKVPVLISALVDRGEPVRVVYTSGNWLDVDSLEDVAHGAVALP